MLTRELFQAPRTGSPQHWDDFCYLQARRACQWVLDLRNTRHEVESQLLSHHLYSRTKSKPKRFGPRVGTRSCEVMRGDVSLFGTICEPSDPKTWMS